MPKYNIRVKAGVEKGALSSSGICGYLKTGWLDLFITKHNRCLKLGLTNKSLVSKPINFFYTTVPVRT